MRVLAKDRNLRVESFLKGAGIVCLNFLIACSSSSSSSGSGTFPNFYTKAKSAVPSVTSSSTLNLQESENNDDPYLLSPSSFWTSGESYLTLPSTYSTSTSDFSTAFSVSQNYIGQVLNDAGSSGPVKSMYVLLSQAQSALTNINSNYSDSSGGPTNCTSIASTKTLTTPFFSTATNASMVTISDAGKYTCYAAQGSTGYLIFGRQAIASPSTGCTDAYEYYVMNGASQKNETNTESVSTRGTTKNVSSIQKFYYNGCTSDLKLIYAQSTKYSLGVEFSSRTEMSGNVTAHSFTIRTDYIDADTSYAAHITIAGTGTSQPASSGTSNFVMGYRTDNCGTASNSSTCTVGTGYTFCAKNSGTVGNYSLDTTTSNCSSLTSTYTGITLLERSDLPTTYFESGTTAAYGL